MLTDDLDGVGGCLLGVSDGVGTQRRHGQTPSSTSGTNKRVYERVSKYARRNE